MDKETLHRNQIFLYITLLKHIQENFSSLLKVIDWDNLEAELREDRRIHQEKFNHIQKQFELNAQMHPQQIAAEIAQVQLSAKDYISANEMQIKLIPVLSALSKGIIEKEKEMESVNKSLYSIIQGGLKVNKN